MSKDPNREPNNILFTSSMNEYMEKMAASKKCFLTADGKYDPAAWLDFVTQLNAHMGHPRRPFTPITGENFKL